MTNKESKQNYSYNYTQSPIENLMQIWGEGYFNINQDGNISIHPNQNDQNFDLYQLTQEFTKRGAEAPVLFRFDGIIRHRIQSIYEGFKKAISEFDYQNNYTLAYPIKVNQQKHVMDIICEEAKKYHLGLEVGSKPELLSMLSFQSHDQALLLCNGYKDAEYIELALLSTKLGRQTIITIEQSYELDLVMDIASKLNIDAQIGFRMKPSFKGSGKWASSSGELAKFGLSTDEIIECVKKLKKANKSHWLKLLHFHIGSQNSSIIPLKKVLREASRVYTELAKICPSIKYFDVGGGLAVDYVGSKTDTDSSMNYSIEEYAKDIVSTIAMTCNEENIQHPIIISESGRAVVAHHSVLVTEVIDVTTSVDEKKKLTPPLLTMNYYKKSKTFV